MCLAELLLAQGSRHSAGHPAAHEKKEELVDDERVKDIARRNSKSVHQVCLRWALQRRPNTSAIFKSTSAEHIKTDTDVADWSLSDEDMQCVPSFCMPCLLAARPYACAIDLASRRTLNNLPVQRRMLLGSVFVSKEGPYHSLKELWDEQVGE